MLNMNNGRLTKLFGMNYLNRIIVHYHKSDLYKDIVYLLESYD
jgi:hypothetical protein